MDGSLLRRRAALEDTKPPPIGAGAGYIAQELARQGQLAAREARNVSKTMPQENPACLGCVSKFLSHLIVENKPMADAKQERARQYLIGEMSDEERIRFEQEYFEDDDLFEELDLVENDLTDFYVRDELSEVERAQFEKEYLISSERQEQVEVARAWTQHVASLRANTGVPETPSALRSQAVPAPLLGKTLLARVASLALAAVALFAAFWIYLANRHLHDQISQLQARVTELQHEEQQLRQAPDRLKAELEQHNSNADGQIAQIEPLQNLTLILTPTLSRESGRQKLLVLPVNPSSVKLELLLERNDYLTYSYSASLKTVDGRSVWQRDGLKSHAAPENHRAISLIVPSQALHHEDYIVWLSRATHGGRLEDVGEYSFRVVKHRN